MFGRKDIQDYVRCVSLGRGLDEAVSRIYKNKELQEGTDGWRYCEWIERGTHEDNKHRAC